MYSRRNVGLFFYNNDIVTATLFIYKQHWNTKRNVHITRAGRLTSRNFHVMVILVLTMKKGPTGWQTILISEGMCVHATRIHSCVLRVQCAHINTLLVQLLILWQSKSSALNLSSRDVPKSDDYILPCKHTIRIDDDDDDVAIIGRTTTLSRKSSPGQSASGTQLNAALFLLLPAAPTTYS